MKNVLYLAAEAKLDPVVGQTLFMPSFANVFKCSVIPWLRDEKINV